MPKGVEHIGYELETNGGRRVELSLMPKGVEYIHDACRLKRHTRVELSLMPKGVEHTSPDGINWTLRTSSYL